MSIEEAINFLEIYQEWRKGRDDVYVNPRKITIAIEKVIEELKLRIKNDNTAKIDIHERENNQKE